MITSEQIEAALGLTGVSFSVTPDGVTFLTANEPVTAEMQAKVQRWYDAGEVNPVPRSVRTAQLEQWLIDRDLHAAVVTKLNDPEQWPDEKTRLKALARWNKEPNTNRDDPLVESIGHSLGMDDAALDAAFIAISEIP